MDFKQEHKKMCEERLKFLKKYYSKYKYIPINSYYVMGYKCDFTENDIREDYLIKKF